MIGKEGMGGMPLLASGEIQPLGLAMVQSTGWAFELDGRVVEDEHERSLLLPLLLRHTQVLVAQIAQTAACIRHHSIIQQMCRWLLLCLDRSETDELVTTQAIIAAKLGVRRAGINECVRRLQDVQLIHCWRGHISVVDRLGLERQACGCYELIRVAYRRMKLDPQVALV